MYNILVLDFFLFLFGIIAMNEYVIYCPFIAPFFVLSSDFCYGKVDCVNQCIDIFLKFDVDFFLKF